MDFFNLGQKANLATYTCYKSQLQKLTLVDK